MATSFSVKLVVVFSVLTVLFVSSNSLIDKSVFEHPNFRAQPIESNYTPTGTTFVLNNMTVYETIDKTVNRVLILGYDAMGLQGNLKQVADKLADEFGFKIVIPDYFRGHEWNDTSYPPEDPEDMTEWLETYANWNRTVAADTMTVINHFRTTENVTQFGVFGFCWGGYFSTQAAIHISDDIKAAAIVHPTFVYNEQANDVKVPMYLLPSKNEINMLPFYMVLQQKFGTNCGHRRFDDMAHAFAGYGGDWTNPLIRLRVDEVIDILGHFFDRNLL